MWYAVFDGNGHSGGVCPAVQPFWTGFYRTEYEFSSVSAAGAPGRKEYLFKRYEEEYREHIAEFGEMCRDAVGDAAIHIAVENTEGFMEHEKQALELLLQQPCFGLTLDIGHSHAAGNVDIPFYQAHEDRLIHMHGHDARGKNCHLAFGDGEIDLAERLSMAEKAGARVVLETKTIEALTKTVAWIRK